ncbi:hypothetical protein M0R04_12130 [Candidatus Dojkabacteria bacterium]|jgi:hypothetical protein|nr:hypothetical protein [Candidatus Dojkabacteria bacterium]
MNDIKQRLLIEGTRKREDILYCMRQLKNHKWTLAQYQHVMTKNIENLNKKKHPPLTDKEIDKLLSDNKDWL